MNNISNYDEVYDFFNAYVVAQQLFGFRILSKEVDIPAGKRFNITFPDTEAPIKRFSLFIYKERDYMVTIYISKDFNFNSRSMRSDLLKKGVRDYRKSNNANNHSYRINFKNIDELQSIFNCFEDHLPKD